MNLIIEKNDALCKDLKLHFKNIIKSLCTFTYPKTFMECPPCDKYYSNNCKGFHSKKFTS